MRSLLNKVVGLVEWQLDLKFTPDERRDFEEIQINKWNRSPAGRESIIELGRTYDQVQRLAPGAKLETANKFREALLATVRQQPESRLAKLVRGAYERAHGGAETVSSPAAPTRAAGPIPPDLVGQWATGSAGAGYYSEGALSGGRTPLGGSGMSFTFSADGRYAETGVLQTSVAACTTVVFNSEEGSFRVNGNTLTVETKGGNQISKDNCNAKFNYRRRMEPRRTTCTWRIEPDTPKPKLCMKTSSGEICAHKQ